MTLLTNRINNQSIIPSTDVIQLTLTLKMTTTAQVVETSVAVNNNSPKAARKSAPATSTDSRLISSAEWRKVIQLARRIRGERA